MGWGVRASFKITLHLKDELLLNQFKSFFQVGNIYYSGSSVYFEVNSLKSLETVISHFNTFPLITQKFADFELFKLAVSKIKEGRHLNMEGLQEIVNIKASMNKGLSEVLLNSFPNSIKIERPKLYNTLNIPNPYWLSGFTSGEGWLFYGKSKKSG